MENLITFEAFSSEGTDPSVAKNPLYALYEEDEQRLFGVFRTQREAENEYDVIKAHIAEMSWDEDFKDEYYGDYDLYELEFDPGLEIRQIHIDNEDDVYNAFESVVMYRDRDLAKTLIEEFGMDPIVYFKNIEDVIEFFHGDLDWWSDPPEKIKRMRRGKSAFGM